MRRVLEDLELAVAASGVVRVPKLLLNMGQHVVIECGFATEPGLEAAFSDGEVSQMPVEGSAEGALTSPELTGRTGDPYERPHEAVAGTTCGPQRC